MTGGRDLNEALMRTIATRWQNADQYFDSIVVFPTGKEDRLVAEFEPGHYPTEISGARLELRLRLNGDMNLHYLEEWSSGTWECRWDRHKNTHNTYEHFHRPPTVRARNADDVDYRNPPGGVFDVAFRFIEERVADLWDDQFQYPGQYTFSWEYGPDIRA